MNRTIAYVAAMLVTLVVAACTANVGPAPTPFDASGDAAPEPAPDGSGYYMAPEQDSAPTPCTKPPATNASLGDDCFAYELADQCAPYECGRTVHYFCNGDAKPHADCHADGTTYHGPSTHGFCCTEAACVHDSSSDVLCNSGEVARSCPTVVSAAPDASCRKVGASERGDPVYCCAQ